jgi:5-methylcytosine-specific restriction endonuclease McrA
METGSKKKKKKVRKKRRKKIPMTWARKINNWNSGIRRRGGEIKLDKEMEMPDCCAYCQEELTPRNASLDHNIPLQRDGRDSLDNYNFICFPCNRSKGTLTGDEYRSLVTALQGLGGYTRDLVLRKLRYSWRVR